MKRTKVTTASLILLLFVALVSMLLLPSHVAMAQDPAVEVAKRTLQGVSDELGWGAMLQNRLAPVTGNGFFIENIVKEVVGLPGVVAVGGVVEIRVFASNEEALQETKKWRNRFVERIQTTAFHGYQALRYTRERPPISGFGWFCGRIYLDVYVLRPGEFPQSLEEMMKVLHQAALNNGLYDYCQTVAVTLAGACASAKPSIVGGSEFKRAKFTIGGTEPQEVRITQPAENFAIVKEYGGIVYQMIDGKSWGSRTLEPGTYILSCSGGGAMGLMSATVCIKYPVVTGAPPVPTPKPTWKVSLPPRPVVLGTAPDGSKLMGVVPGAATDYAPGSLRFAPGRVIVEVGKTIPFHMYIIFSDGHTESGYWDGAEPGYLARVARGGTTQDGKSGITHITGTKAGKGWLIRKRGVGSQTRLRLLVTAATQPPTFKKGGVTIEGKVTYRGNPVPEAKIMFNHKSGKSFQDPTWKTKDDGSFRIVTKKLWAGKYRIRVFKQARRSFGKTMWSKVEKEPEFTVLAGKTASFGPCDIEMETMREKYKRLGITIPAGF